MSQKEHLVAQVVVVGDKDASTMEKEAVVQMPRWL
jgi:hypothetical protein